MSLELILVAALALVALLQNLTLRRLESEVEALRHLVRLKAVAAELTDETDY